MTLTIPIIITSTLLQFLSSEHFLMCRPIFPVCDPRCSAPVLCLAPPHLTSLYRLIRSQTRS